MFLLLLASCELTPEEMCAGKGDTSIALGRGTGQDFQPFQDGDEVEILSAPQGGHGIQIRAQTTGLKTNDLLDLDMYSSIDGVDGEPFLWEAQPLWCQEDGTGLFWGAIVPLDPTDWPDDADLSPLEGATAVLHVTAVDAEGDEVSGEASVSLTLPQ